MTVSGLNHLSSEVRLGPRVGVTPPPMLWEGTQGPRSDMSRSWLSENVSKILIWAHLGLLGPLEAKPNTMVGSKVVYGTLEQVASIQRAEEEINHDNIALEISKKH